MPLRRYIHNPDVRAKKFIGRTGQKITAQRLHIRQVMRQIVHRIDIHHRPDLMRRLNNSFKFNQ
ncbi:Uncharacterised protein [Vibrio cholerae]|nr:Uncharacterised protein [Vibrio cholerae]